MKLNTLKSLCLISSLIGSTAALAMDFEPRLYMGVEGQWDRSNVPNKVEENNYSMQGENFTEGENKSHLFRKGGLGIGAFVGLNISDCIGIEGGFTKLSTKKTDMQASSFIMPPELFRFLAPAPGYVDTLPRVVTNKLTLSQHNIYADVLGYLPMSDDIKIIGSVGLGLLASKYHDHPQFDVLPAFNKTYRRIGIRAGLGGQLAFTENVGTRLMVRYQKGNKVIKDMTSMSLGLFYQF